MIFRGENPANGALLDFWLAKADTAVTLTIRDSRGRVVRSLLPAASRATEHGMNRVVWNLREEDLPIRGGGFAEEDNEPRRNLAGPYVAPGTYTVRLEAAEQVLEQKVEVRDDPRVDAAVTDRRACTRTSPNSGNGRSNWPR